MLRAFLLSTAVATAPMAQADCAADAMLVFDGSASMARLGPDPSVPTRIEEARAAVARVMPQVEQVRRIGLMTYGPDGDTGCSGLRIHFPPKEYAADSVLSGLTALRPEGQTPLSASVELAAELLNYRTEPAVIVLVTDGDETCGGRPCEMAGRLANGAADLTIHVIGFRGEGRVLSWRDPGTVHYARDSTVRCLSDRTDGVFAATRSEGELVGALRQVLGCPVVGRLE
jgi:Ca-activated chloride channel family protein